MADLEFFFNPRSIAVIGASATPGKIGHALLKSIIDGGYLGNIYPINHADEVEVLGYKAYKSILDVEGEIDLAVFALSAIHATKIAEQCGKKGVLGLVIISGGFKELGSQGKLLEEETVKIAQKYNIRIIGPNCMGVFNPKAKLDTFFQPRYAMARPGAGRIGVITQSGTFGISILECISSENLGVSKFVSYGNKADVDELDMFRYFESDSETEVIAVYVESLTNGRQFVELARNVVKKTPIVLLKGGRTDAGSTAAASHTGALAGDYAAFTTAMKQSGVILVQDIDEMMDTVKILAMQPLPSGRNVAMVTNGVGPCVVAADEIAVSKHLTLVELDGGTIDHLKQTLPPFCVFSNPLDITGSATASWFKTGLEALNDDDIVNILMPFFVFQDAPLAETMDDFHGIMDTINQSEKTMLCVASGGEYTGQQVRKLQDNGMPVIPTPKRAVAALSNVVWYANYLKRKNNSV